jgi:hypothetical protein
MQSNQEQHPFAQSSKKLSMRLKKNPDNYAPGTWAYNIVMTRVTEYRQQAVILDDIVKQYNDQQDRK